MMLIDPSEKIIQLGCSDSFFPVHVNLFCRIKNLYHSLSGECGNEKKGCIVDEIQFCITSILEVL